MCKHVCLCVHVYTDFVCVFRYVCVNVCLCARIPVSVWSCVTARNRAAKRTMGTRQQLKLL